ncbi:recombinase [Rhodovulum sp. BSW8]|uniref:YqaJ viral recombinase family nuclease n=1 Tax=Rhodovulum sp. BSW8 TaxID=2259645 RepID=UPI000DE509B4|nr:YqaJ viral recombinase family protein [Rhodovulum sp. BSW8]RBO54681.1 recombinase [Rhodovulum sp. BSW8]
MNVQTRTAWLAERRTGIGGSDIAAIVGLSRWATPYDVWLDKTGQAEDSEETEFQYWGTVLEDVVAKEYAKRTGQKVQRVNQRLIHPELPIAAANIDRAVVNPAIRGNVRWIDGRLTTDRLLECKTADRFAAADWGDPGSDEVPEYYLIQTQWYMGITGAAVADLAVLIGGNDYRVYTIGRDDTLIADLLEAANDFWRDHVETRAAPDPQTIADAKRRWARHIAGTSVDVEYSTLLRARRMNEVKEQIKALEKEADACALDLMRQFRDAETLLHAGDKVATWKTQEAERIDVKALRADHPDIAALYSTKSETRVLRLAKAAKE